MVLISKNETWKIFDKIATYYDLINRILSFGIDKIWRKKMARFVRDRDLVLDIATGTADVPIAILKKRCVKGIVCIDRSMNMLIKGIKKVKHKNAFFILADGMELPFKSYSFDAITMAFGIRNMSDPKLCLNECYRVLKRGGRIIILEFSMPKNWLVKLIYLFYLRHILPYIGRVISKDPYAYRYLNKTIEEFPYGDRFLSLLKEVGFSKTSFFSQTFGVCNIYLGEKWNS